MLFCCHFIVIKMLFSCHFTGKEAERAAKVAEEDQEEGQ
jgi:hypothetical protein